MSFWREICGSCHPREGPSWERFPAKCSRARRIKESPTLSMGKSSCGGRRKKRPLSKASQNSSNASGRRTLGCKMCNNSFEMAFLHGHDTSCRGSWLGEQLECQQAACKAWMQAKLPAARIRAQECPVCKQERASKKRMPDGTPNNFSKTQIDGAKAVFATNAVKYHANKLRAQEWARRHGQTVQYAIARDIISSHALQCRKNPIWEKTS